MTLEIKTSSITPIRQNYAYIERRFGAKPATRYQEVSFDIQGAANFHYRPLWNPDKSLNDANYTALKMQDWYVFKDPRQFYYGAYVQHRARLQDIAESNYAFFEKRQLADNLTATVKNKIISCLLPFRYVEQTANLHMMSGSAYGYGTVITQACMFAAMDRLGMAQYLSRIGLLLDGNTGESLQQAKEIWMNDPAWQPLRQLCEQSLTEQDWFKLYLLQTLLIDSFMQSLVYGQFDQLLVEQGARDIAMLTEFMQDCITDLRKWADPVLKLAVAESDQNKTLIEDWIATLRPQVEAAFSAWSTLALAGQPIDAGLITLEERMKKANLNSLTPSA
ncbi:MULTISPECIES: aromatic/alkene monooxygenase hydroxylase subunit beta [unclassified Acinetobacter]|uniref:aromatic/alkene monooxygenase hydroxylase subunit beta n=1 Tax=unclassified Acinetobacter TaxID=196816 RepID=UPI002934A71B|nr:MULTISPECIES: aromatic/alkene monooxygenase hydroxylase subunit beta [unclassified Acinetobacter]WOE30758.1 aromatic/alkene monooxygenase hydroxylase subunit beta [Acinetobacter sp. SAAs470]WOE38951.1 aromatic/alkene monooxygenase hydroxylase subunit beta [Acinetobacter sp. SAAs474]